MLSTLILATFALQRFEFHEVHMGIEVRISLYAPSRLVAETAAISGFAEFKRIDQVASDYLLSSELSKLNQAFAGTQLAPPPHPLPTSGEGGSSSRG